MVRSMIARLAVVYLACGLVGCASTGLFSKAAFPKTGPRNPAIRILGLWQPGEGVGIENKTSRGFSGQIMFFGRNSDLPAQVDGAVRIYVFDDHGSAEEQAKPIHEFEFSPGAWKAHLFKGPLGATYDVFIPYTRPGIHEAKCTLRVKYIPKDAPEVYSDMVNIVLPGIKKATTTPAPDGHPESIDRESGHGDESTGSELPDLVRKGPSRARTMTQAMPTPEEIQKMLNRKPAAQELTAAERRRIMREATARLNSENRSGVVLAGYEEPANGETETIQRAGGLRSSNRLADDLSDDPDDQELNAPRSLPAGRGKNPLE